MTQNMDFAIILCKVYLTLCCGGVELKNRVKELREKQGLTQKQLGEQVGVSRQAINAIEVNKFDPSIWLAYDLACFFEITIEELFDFKESERK